MKRAIGLTFAVLLVAAPASAETVLSLSNSATLSVQPDELDATLRAEAEAPSAAAAQSAVNRRMAQALAAARGVPGVQAETGQYGVWPQPPANGAKSGGGWHASQSLDLRGHDEDGMLHLVGALQQQGLAVEQLGWRLSEDASRKAHETALRQAVAGLRHRADMIAGLLGLRFDSFRAIRVADAEPPRFPIQARAMMATAGAPLPSVQSGPVSVSATVTADAVLVPENAR